MAIKTSRWTFAKKSPMACFTPIVGATVTRVKRCEAASFLYVLIELLNEKGILTVEELGERKRVG